MNKKTIAGLAAALAFATVAPVQAKDQALTEKFAQCMAMYWTKHHSNAPHKDIETENEAESCANALHIENWGEIDWDQFHRVPSFCPPEVK